MDIGVWNKLLSKIRTLNSAALTSPFPQKEAYFRYIDIYNLKNFVTVIVRLGTGVMCNYNARAWTRFCVNYCLTSIFGLCVIPVFSGDDPACSRCGSGVLYWMGDGTVYLLPVALLLYLAKQLPKFWCVDNFVFIYCRLWIALQYCLWNAKALAILEREEMFSIIWSKNLARYTVCKTHISVPN